MKRVFLIILILILVGCSKEENCSNPIDCLPPKTSKGLQTAGCLINGNVLIPAGNGFGSGSVLKADYLFNQNVHSFVLIIRDLSSNKVRDLSLELRDNVIEEGGTYQLTKVSDSTNYATYYEDSKGTFTTNNTVKGEVHFTKFDLSKRIASGTFSFAAQNENLNEKIQVSEGRFDVVFY